MRIISSKFMQIRRLHFKEELRAQSDDKGDLRLEQVPPLKGLPNSRKSLEGERGKRGKEERAFHKKPLKATKNTFFLPD